MKITNAMYTISSSKLKKARKNLTDTEPYFYALQRTISRIVRHTPEIEDPYFDTRPQIKPEDQLTTDGQKEEDSRDWYEVLWDSVAEPPKEEAPSEQVNHLPIESAPEEKADVR